MGENWNPFLRPQGYFRCIRCTCKLVSTSFILSSIPFIFLTDPFSCALAKTLIEWAYFFGTCDSSSYCLGVSMKLFIYFLKIKPHHATLSLFLICIYIFFDDWLLSTCIQWSPEPTLFENALQTRNIKKKHRFHIAQGSHWIRQIWRILRQNCSDDSTEVTEGVTSTPEIFGNKHSFVLTFFATNTIYVTSKRCKP